MWLGPAHSLGWPRGSRKRGVVRAGNEESGMGDEGVIAYTPHCFLICQVNDFCSNPFWLCGQYFCISVSERNITLMVILRVKKCINKI